MSIIVLIRDVYKIRRWGGTIQVFFLQPHSIEYQSSVLMDGFMWNAIQNGLGTPQKLLMCNLLGSTFLSF